MRISGMWVKNCIFFVVSTTNGDIREQKSGCVSHQRRCYKLLYKENANLTHLETQPNQYIATTNAAFIFFPGHSSSHLYGLAKPFFRRSFIGRLSPPRGMASTKSESQSLTEFCFEKMRAVTQRTCYCKIEFSVDAWWVWPMTTVILFCYMKHKLNNIFFLNSYIAESVPCTVIII